MVQPYPTNKKISFQTVDMEVTLVDLEYEYLRFICSETLRNSDDIIREQIRTLQIAGRPSFEEWRQQKMVRIGGYLAPAALEANTVVVDAETTDVEQDRVGQLETNETAKDAISLEISLKTEPEPIAEPTPVKRRGRQKKAESASTERAPTTAVAIAETPEVPAEKPRRGRGRQPKSAETPTPISEAPTTPKRRGRKKTSDEGASSNSASDRAAAAEAAIAELLTVTNSQNQEPAKRRRGSRATTSGDPAPRKRGQRAAKA